MVTSVFKPNPMEEGSAEVGKHMLGALFHGAYQKCVRNKKASVVWEASSLYVTMTLNCHDIGLCMQKIKNKG